MFFLAFLEALALTSALSADSFVSAFAYGTDKVKIPFKSCVIISLICTAMLTAALALGDLAGSFVPLHFAVWISFSIFVVIGSIKILSPLIKGIKKRRSPTSVPCNYDDTVQDNINTPDNNSSLLTPNSSLHHTRRLTIAQSALLAVALSLDGLGIGIGYGLGTPNFPLIITLSLITNCAALLLGALAGNKLSKKIRFSLSWLSGVVLIGIGISSVLF
ncbi:MAG: manganese efflux pump [Firmicutes bacterium]|nr:manganese efflux pump [Bacillota bacterium]